MKNAHERFGTLEFTKRMKDTVTQIRVCMARLIVEPANEDRGQGSAHLISVVGADAEIAAVWAAVTEGAPFKLYASGAVSLVATLGPEAQCFRRSLVLPGRKRPVRHLVALSAESVKTRPGADREAGRAILCDDDPVFVLYRVARRFGLPVVPEWAPWFMRELGRRKAVQPLLGLGCSPVMVRGTKQTFLSWIGKALKHGLIRVPEEEGAIPWKRPKNFLRRSNALESELTGVAM